MMKSVQWIIDRFVERTVPLVGHLFSATLQSMHAISLAQHQSELEDAARRFEAEGKPEIAATLRRRSEQLDAAESDTDEAVRIASSVASPLTDHLPADAVSQSAPRTLPAPSKPKARRKRRSAAPTHTFDLQDNANTE